MYNLCIFIFIIYAISYSASEILLKRKRDVSSNSGRKLHLSKVYFPDHEQRHFGTGRTQRDVSSNSGRKLHLPKVYFPDHEQRHFSTGRTQRDVSSNSERKNRP